MKPGITIVGLGPGDPGLLTESALAAMKESSRVFLRTEEHPVVPWLRAQGLKFKTFDYLYNKAPDFQWVYSNIASIIADEGQMGQVVYAVPGHPLVAEESVSLILNQCPNDIITVIPGLSFLDVMFSALRIDPSGGLNVVDGLRLGEQRPNPAMPVIVTQVYNRLVASEIKLCLMEYYPGEHQVIVVRAAGVPGQERIKKCPLFAVDRLDWIDHLTSLYLPAAGQQNIHIKYPMDPLVDVMNILRSENGCPWDREQNHLSLRRYLLEETYEVLEALEKGEMYNICEELGDLLLQIVFHSQIASEGGFFDINDVVKSITEKMIRRHPHVFGSVKVESSQQVLVNWAAIKEMEKDGLKRKSILSGVGKGLPALPRAQKTQSVAARVGFDWPDYKGAMDKVHEEVAELQEAIGGHREQVEQEMGDVLFAAVNLARLLEVDAEVALASTVTKFERRFKYIEDAALETGREIASLTLEEMDSWWEEAKLVEKRKKIQE